MLIKWLTLDSLATVSQRLYTLLGRGPLGEALEFIITVIVHRYDGAKILYDCIVIIS